MSKELSLEQARARSIAIDDQEIEAAIAWFRETMDGPFQFLIDFQEFCARETPEKGSFVDRDMLVFLKRFAVLGFHRVMEAAFAQDAE